VHGHAIEDVTGLAAALLAAGGTPEIADVVGLVAALAGKAAVDHLHAASITVETPGSAYSNTTTTYAAMSQAFDLALSTTGAACKVVVEVEGIASTPNGGGSSRSFVKLQALIGSTWTDVSTERTVGGSRTTGTSGSFPQTGTFLRTLRAKLSNAQQKTGGGWSVRVAGKIVDAGAKIETSTICADMAECT